MSAGPPPDDGIDPAQQIFIDAAQRAAGVIAARGRGDLAGAEALLADFDGEPAKVMGFFLLAELSLQLLAKSTGKDLEFVAQHMSLDIAAAFARP